jgi:hypothetical protein
VQSILKLSGRVRCFGLAEVGKMGSSVLQTGYQVCFSVTAEGALVTEVGQGSGFGWQSGHHQVRQRRSGPDRQLA